MRVALTFNLRRSKSEDEAEFDSPATVTMLTRLLEELGHVVVPVDVSCAITSLVARLRKAAPDVVFNIAEGRRGTFREAFYPALFAELGLPHTGSSASVLSLCLDKDLAKRVVGAAGVRVPRGVLVRSLVDLERVELPAIVKPNFEGSSKGITQDSVASDRASLEAATSRALARWPEGIVVESYVEGADVAVGFVEGIGVLDPIGYAYEPTGPHRILDLELKQGPPERVSIEWPAKLDERATRAVREAAGRSFAALGVTGFGRADFRVTDAGDVYFLEMNPLPSLAAGDDELWLAAANAGWSRSDLVASILVS